MERLELLWKDQHDEGVPFRSNADVDAVALTVKEIVDEGCMNSNIASSVDRKSVV